MARRLALIALCLAGVFFLRISSSHFGITPATAAGTDPTCSLDLPSTTAPSTLFPITWSSTNATHAAFAYAGLDLYGSKGELSPRDIDAYYLVTGSSTGLIRASSGTSTIAFCFDQNTSYTGTYVDCLGRTPHIVCSKDIMVVDTSGSGGTGGTGGTNPTPTPTPNPTPTSWTPPVGIPTPPYPGITESVSMYAGKMFTAGGFPYRDVGNGPYTHYVDASRTCTDIDNPYGTEGNPRCTIPTTIPAGSVIELHGTYSQNREYPNNIVMSGTANAPVFIRGASAANRPMVTQAWWTAGSYYVIENINFNITAQLTLQGTAGTLRYSEIHGTTAGGGVATFSVAGMIIYKNLIHNNGDYLSTSETDHHGIKVGASSQGTSYVWIVDNESYQNSGDSVQISDAPASEPWPQYIFIGRNKLHQDKENAVDIKTSRDVIVSQNFMYSYSTSPSSSGEVTVTHGSTNAFPQRIWIVDNIVCCSAQGIVATGADGYYVIGNAIYNIDGPNTPNSNYGPSGILTYSTTNVFIANNSLWNVEKGISQPNSAATIVNNIIGHVNDSTASQISLGTSVAVTGSTVDYNLFGDLYNLVNGWDTLSLVRTNTGRCANACINFAPYFVNQDVGNLHLTPSSLAVDHGFDISQITTSFQNTYGASIAYDIDGTPRPKGNGWDIGAYESAYSANVTPINPYPGGPTSSSTNPTASSTNPTASSTPGQNPGKGKGAGTGAGGGGGIDNIIIPAAQAASLSDKIAAISARLTDLIDRKKKNQIDAATLNKELQSIGADLLAVQGELNKIIVANEPIFTKTLSLGLRGDSQVQALQSLLVRESLYSGPLNGNFFTLTEAAVKRFQTKYGIDPVGIVGPKTREKLNALAQPATATSTASTQ